MSWILSLLLLVALQPPHGSASLIGEEIQVYEDAEVYEEDPRVEATTVRTLGLATTPDPCIPSCVGANDEEPLVPDPLDCHKFYLCFNDELNGPMDCPDGEYFNTTGKECVPNEAEECEPICKPGTGGVCSYTCGNSTTKLVADRFDCSSYYNCSSTETVRTCPAAMPFFDGNKCQANETACCHCMPYCYVDDVDKRVMDPLNCTKYYFCFEGNEFPEFSATCPPGSNFDIFKQECSSTAPCITLCTKVIPKDLCIDVFTCQEEGYFAACHKVCDPRYYHCCAADIGNTVEASTCPEGMFFHPDVAKCFPLEECPYNPSSY